MDYNEFLSKHSTKTNNGKTVYSLKALCEYFKDDYKKYINSVLFLMEKFKDISLYAGNIISFSHDDFHNINDILLSNFGLMIFAKEMYNMQENNAEKWLKIAEKLNKNIGSFYAEKRLIARKQYSEINNQLSKMLASMSFVRVQGIASCMQELYTTILTSYYGVKSKDELYKLKNIPQSRSYLDYISLKELSDLKNIQKDLILFIMDNQAHFYDILNAASNIARKASEDYTKTFKKSPLQKPAHTNTPSVMLKKFYKLLDSYSLNYKKIEEDTKK